MTRKERESETGCVERLQELAATRGFWTHVVPGSRPSSEDAGMSAIEGLSLQPGIAVVTGECRGFDLELVLAASLVVAGPGARFRGEGAVTPRFAGTLHRLRERLGAGGVLAFWLGPRAWGARRARARGLVDALSDDAEDFARANWESLWSRQASATEKLVLLGRARAGLSESSATALERALFALSFADERAREGARGFFE